MKNNIFSLSNLVLYSKGWYKKTDDIWVDLKKILALDDYSPSTKWDIYSIISSRFQEFEHRSSELKEVLNGIHPDNCWKFGYYTKGFELSNRKKTEDLPEYDMPTAFIYYVISKLRDLDLNQWNVIIPKYKLYPKGDEVRLKDVVDCFKNRNK